MHVQPGMPFMPHHGYYPQYAHPYQHLPKQTIPQQPIQHQPIPHQPIPHQPIPHQPNPHQPIPQQTNPQQNILQQSVPRTQSQSETIRSISQSQQQIPLQSTPQQNTRANSIPQKINDSMRNSQQLPLKLVSSPSLLSKQALDLKDSLDKLKQLSARKILKEEARLKLDEPKRETFGKEKERPIGKTPNFGIVPVSQEPQRFFQQSDKVPSPIKKQLTQTQQSDLEIHKIYNYQDTNESHESHEERMLNIYSSKQVTKIDLIASVNSIRQQTEERKEDDEQLPQSRQVEQPKESSPVKVPLPPPQLISHQREPSVKKPSTYSKMSPDEANKAYQNRRNEIKSHLQKTKQASKYKAQQVQQTKHKVKVAKQNPTASAPQKIETINLSRTHKKKKSDMQSPTSGTPREPHQEPQELFPSVKPVEEPIPAVNHQQPNYYSEKKQTLLQDILTIDKEIRHIEYQMIAESRSKGKLNVAGNAQSSTQMNRSLDSQIKSQQRPEYKHRAEHLYEQGQLREEKKKIMNTWTRIQKKQQEQEECTFKPQTLQSHPIQKNFFERQKDWNDKKKKEPSQNSGEGHKGSGVVKHKSPQLNIASTVLKKSKVASLPQKSPQSSTFSQEQSKTDNDILLKTAQALKVPQGPQQLTTSTEYFSIPIQFVPTTNNHEKVLAVTHKYEQIVAQANQLKASLGLV